MVSSFHDGAVSLFLATILLSVSISLGSPKRSVDEHQQLIQEGATVLSNSEDLKGFEIFRQEQDGSNTVYTSEDNPSFKFVHAGDDVTSTGNVIILDPTEDKIPRKDKIMYLVLHKRKEDPKTFTAHLVYVRKFKGETSLEWDYFLSDESKEVWSFVKSFSPAKFLHLATTEVNSNRLARDIEAEAEAVEAAPGFKKKVPKKKSSSSEEAAAAKKKKKKKKKKEETEEDEEEPLPPECTDKKEERRRKKRKSPKVVYKININHIVCASGGECKPDPCLGKGKKDEDKAKGRSMGMEVPKIKQPLFVGLGNCEKVEPIASTDSKKATLWAGSDELISFIMQSLRVQCIPQSVAQIQSIFTKKMVTSDETFHLNMNYDHPLFKIKAPGMNEWSEISSALYFKVYTNTYLEEAAKMTENELKAMSPSNKPISPSVEILTIITHKLIHYFKKQFEPHIYKLIKSQEAVLETKYAETLKDKETITDDNLKSINLNDLIQLRALHKLISLGSVAEILEQNTVVETAFETLYNKNLDEFTGAAQSSSPLQ